MARAKINEIIKGNNCSILLKGIKQCAQILECLEFYEQLMKDSVLGVWGRESNNLATFSHNTLCIHRAKDTTITKLTLQASQSWCRQGCITDTNFCGQVLWFLNVTIG